MGNLSAERRTGEFFNVYGRVPEHRENGLQLIYFGGIGQSFEHYAQFAPSLSRSEGKFVEYWQVPSETSEAKRLLARRERVFQTGEDGSRKLASARLDLIKDDGLTYMLRAESKAMEIGQPDPEEVNRFSIGVTDRSGNALASARYDDIGAYRPSFEVETSQGKLEMLSPVFYKLHERWGVSLNDELLKEAERDSYTGWRSALYLPLGSSLDLPGVDLRVGLDVSEYGMALRATGQDDLFFVVPRAIDPADAVRALRGPYHLTFDLTTNVTFGRSDLIRG